MTRKKYNWGEIFLGLAQEIKPEINDLQQAHLYFPLDELITLRKRIEKYTNSNEFGRMVDDYIEEYMEPLLPSREYLIQRTAGVRIVVPNQELAGRLLSFHTGYWTGYNNSMYTVWTPVTDAYDSNSMQVLSWEDTKEIMTIIHENKSSLEEVQTMCEKVCWPVNLKYGNAWLFNQGHLHGNINNATNVTRMSFDVRMALKGEDFGYRRAGSFYRFKGESAESSLSRLARDGRWVVYVDQDCEYIYPTPNFMVREFLLSHSKNLNITITEWHNEYRYCTWCPQFVNLVSQGYVNGIVVPSVYAFSFSAEELIEVLKLALKNQVQILFADESLLLSDSSDLEHIKKLFDFIR
jgi:sporadic carbohydrate cluster 2OG-Fe(II) oxygenase